MTTPCSNLPQEYCGFYCPSFIVYLVLVFAHIAASLPGLMGSIRAEMGSSSSLEHDSKLTFKLYSATGTIATALQIVFLPWIYPLVTTCLYVFIIVITRECLWKKKPTPDMEQGVVAKPEPPAPAAMI